VALKQLNIILPFETSSGNTVNAMPENPVLFGWVAGFIS